MNYFEILEIPSDADEREIKRAYYRLARALHPDKASSSEEVKDFEERFALVSTAYNALKNPEKRSEHIKQTQRSAPQKAHNASAAALTTDRKAPQPSGAPGRPSIGITPERIAIAQKAFTRGMQFFKENNFLKATSFFEAAIQNNDQEGLYHARLAMALIQSRKSATRAIDAAQRAIELDPYNHEHKFSLGFIYETIGSASNAKKAYEEILRWDADNQQARLCLNALKKRKKSGDFSLHPSTQQSPQANNGKPSGFLQQILGLFRKP
jgi:curved DNA-binding protein CbpA